MASRRPKTTYGRFSRKSSKPAFEIFDDGSTGAAATGTASIRSVPCCSSPAALPLHCYSQSSLSMLASILPPSSCVLYFFPSARLLSSHSHLTISSALATEDGEDPFTGPKKSKEFKKQTKVTMLKEKSNNHPVQKREPVAAAQARTMVSVEIASNLPRKTIVTTSLEGLRMISTPINGSRNLSGKNKKPAVPDAPSRRQSHRIVSVGDEDVIKTPHSTSSADSSRSWVQGVMSSAKKAAERLKTFAGSASPSPKGRGGGKYVKIRGKENQIPIDGKEDDDEKARVSFPGSIKSVKKKGFGNAKKHKRTSSSHSQLDLGNRNDTPAAGKKLRHISSRVDDSHTNFGEEDDELSLPNGSYSCSYEDITSSAFPLPSLDFGECDLADTSITLSQSPIRFLSTPPVTQSTPKRDWRNSGLHVLAEQLSTRSQDDLPSSIDGRLEAYRKLDGHGEDIDGVSDDELMDGYGMIPARCSSRMKTGVRSSMRMDPVEEENAEPMGRLKRSSKQLNLASNKSGGGSSGFSSVVRKTPGLGETMMDIDEGDELAL